MKAYLWCGERLAAYQVSMRGTSGRCRKYSKVITPGDYCFTLEQSPNTKSANSIFRSNSFWQYLVLIFSKKFCESPELTHVGFFTAGVFPEFMKFSYDHPSDFHCNAYEWIQLSGVKPHALFRVCETLRLLWKSEKWWFKDICLLGFD